MRLPPRPLLLLTLLAFTACTKASDARREHLLGGAASRTDGYGEPEQRRPGAFLAVSRVRTSGTAH